VDETLEQDDIESIVNNLVTLKLINGQSYNKYQMLAAHKDP
jgi:hypothetical protein